MERLNRNTIIRWYWPVMFFCFGYTLITEPNAHVDLTFFILVMICAWVGRLCEDSVIEIQGAFKGVVNE